VSTSTWSTWARDHTCAPAAVERPAGTAEVADAVCRAAADGHTVRVAGSGHSFGDLVGTGGVLLSLERMDRVLQVDADGLRVRVQGGITLRRLNRLLAAQGVALENLGDIDTQTLAGAISTATHGTGARLPNLSAQVEGLELVLADGMALSLTGEDRELLAAARVGLGALGIITEVVLRIVPAFTLRAVDALAPLERVLAGFDEHVAGHDHFEFFVFPYTSRAIARTLDRVDDPPRPRGRLRAWAEDVALANGAFGAVCHAGRRAPRLVPALNRTVTRLAGGRVEVDRSHRIFANERRVRFTETEWALPREAAPDVVRAVLSLVHRRRLPINFPLEVRCVAADERSLLSPAWGRETAYVAAHVFEGMEAEPFLRAVGEIAAAHDGRPHWGKRHFLGAAELTPRYPGWARFQAVRARLDPGGRFTNKHVRRVLGAPMREAEPAHR
jgi:L-gulonolactone oxidase